jgi:2-desacetyl-2-hydroxyethyl bacteriochlorophyllide A dehydrogenase
MKAALFRGPRDVVFQEVERPTLDDGEVLVRVRACGICGSDLHTYRHGMFEGLGLPVEGGRILGHEFSGEVVEVRGEVEGVSVGDRVIAPGMGANAEYWKGSGALAPLMLRVPDHTSFEEAATTEPLATSLHAVNLAQPRDEETIVILGAGIIGLGALQCVKAVSTANVIVVDLSDHRLAVAEKLGADTTINAGRENTLAKVMELAGTSSLEFVDVPQGNVDTVLDCAGVTRDFKGVSALEQALLMVKQDGKVVVVAAFEKPLEIELNIIMRKGIRLLGSWAWSPEEFAQSLDLIGSGKIDRRPLISHEFPLEQASEAYETQLRAEEAIKVLIKP